MKPRSGAVDPYFPHNGDWRYTVQHYDLQLTYQPDNNQLRGRAVIDAVAACELSDLRLDLHALRVTKVQVDGGSVAKYVQGRHGLTLRLRRAVAAGQQLRIVVTYQGRPLPVPDGGDETGWEELEDGVLVAGQTNGAPSWFPCNDRPSDKASYRMEVTAPSVYTVVANGVLRSRRRAASTTTWVYEQSEPMATYLATVQIGRYARRTVEGAAVPIHTALPDRLRSRYGSSFGRQPDMVTFFERLFGPYPFAAYTIVITPDDLEIPLEAQGMSVFGANFLTGGWENVRLVAHELSHQWFGNCLTLGVWRDIWLHEGFACYCEWLWSEESGGRTADERARDHWAKLAAKPQDLLLGDPGPKDMFDDRVYKRGALLLHAIRVTVGDDAFFGLLRAWVDRNRYGTVTTEMFEALAAELVGVPSSLFTDWLRRPSLPALPGR